MIEPNLTTKLTNEQVQGMKSISGVMIVVGLRSWSEEQLFPGTDIQKNR